MTANVRVRCDENVVLNPSVEIRSGEDWLDIARMVSRVRWDVAAGDVNHIHLELLPVDVELEGLLAPGTLEAFAAILNERGWSVAPPSEGRVFETTGSSVMTS